ncbi:DNA photolyase family protein [Leptolyngbya sp. GB1-A1]|uniref:cryptochrome/photolyase family protein n=1 Tax=Leptolyngbya sp. GB1-A1 TaxID=2933908 RepID=UPI00329835F6
MSNCTIVWFRRDLRISDHAPLDRAARRGAVVPVFVFDPALLHHPETAPARVAFLLKSLQSLDADLQERGGRLILRLGDPLTVLPQLIRETKADGIYAHLDFERLYGRVRDARLNRILTEQDLKIRWFEPSGTTPDLMTTRQYRQLWYDQMREAIVPTPQRIEVPSEVLSTSLPTLADLKLHDDGKPLPPAGTQAAYQLLDRFLEEKTQRYYWQLSYPSAAATSGLSPHIKFGVISLRQCYHAAQTLKTVLDERVQRSRKQFIARLRWNSGFAQRFRYLPQLEVRSLYRHFDEQGFEFDEDLYQAWQQGQTGFPIIDAAARCLIATGGWQAFNFRTRACYASFLSNLLGMDWRYGALHFMRHLIDGDCPIDHYQWAMQAGITAAIDQSWTRIYNPGQAAVDRFDPQGQFIKRWVPELRHLSPQQLGTPPSTKGYPAPILDYRQARAKRVQQLDRQRQELIQQGNLVPYLAPLPESFLPFGSDRVQCDVSWAGLADRALFPTALNLAELDESQAQMLRTWFVGAARPSKPSGARKSPSKSQAEQLTLL